MVTNLDYTTDRYMTITFCSLKQKCCTNSSSYKQFKQCKRNIISTITLTYNIISERNKATKLIARRIEVLKMICN